MKVFRYSRKQSVLIWPDIYTSRSYISPISSNGACSIFWEKVKISYRFVGLIFSYLNKQKINKGHLRFHAIVRGDQVYLIVVTGIIKINTIVKTINEAHSEGFRI